MDRFLTVCFVLLPLHTSLAEDPAAHRRFEYKLSFKGPHLALPNGDIPFWDHYGDALPGPEEVRLVPSLKSKRGSLWTRYNASFEHWQVEVAFRIQGQGRNGADGLAVWYTRQRGITGPVYGAADFWDGVGIFFDSFDNDGHKNNPIILVIGNNGKLIYDHPNDGASQALGSCVRNFRNTPHPFRARITYYRRTLTVSVNSGFSPKNDFYELCAELKDMTIPSLGFFGVSAATGGLADDHDVFSFLTFSLSERLNEDPDTQISDSEKDKYEEEFEHFQKDFERQKEEFQKEHPFVPTPEEELFESDSQRELDMVLQGQRRVLEELNLFSKRLIIVSEEQTRHFDLLARTSKNESTTTVKGGQAIDLLNALHNGQTEMLQKLQEMRAYILKIASKAKELYPSTESATSSQGNIKEIKETVNMMKRGLQGLVKNMDHGQKLKCPVVPVTPSCVSSSSFMFVLLIQVICAVSYILYRSRKKEDAKKFF